MTTLLQRMADERAEQNERLRGEVLSRLRTALREVLPDRTPVIFFGSLIRPGSFTEDSDVDMALAAEPPGMTIYQLTAQLSERLGRRVDVLLLSECRFRDKILREGETWTS